jgi:hypothetical protein
MLSSLSRQVSLFCLAVSLPSILKEIEQAETHKERKELAEKNLEHLSSGSSRIVYLSPKHTIIKIAKNDKGFAQNKAEANPKVKSKFLNKILSHAKDYSWVETRYLDKITIKDFREMTNMDFDDFSESLRYVLKSKDSSGKKPKNFQEISNSEFFKEMVKIAKENDLLSGDLARISSWGTADGHPVLIDAGLTSKIFEKFYASDSKSSKGSSS